MPETIVEDGGGTSTSTTKVTVMSAEQTSELITSLTSVIEQLVTAVETLNQKLTGMEEDVHGINQILFGHLPVLSNIERRIGDIPFASIAASNNICQRLETDISDKDKLNLAYDSKIGTRSIAYTLASAHELKLLNIKKADDEAAASNGGEESGSGESTESTGIFTKVINKSKKIFEDLVTFQCDVTLGERIRFKTTDEFTRSGVGLPFDYSRYFATRIIENTDTDDIQITTDDVVVNEYALLVFDSALKSSIFAGSNGVNKVKTWEDIKIIQTIVIVENKLDKTAQLYMPSESNFTEIDFEKYKDSKVAMDTAVDKYLTSLETQYKGIAVIPVDSIEQGITLEEYRTAAKNITPTCEYA